MLFLVIYFAHIGAPFFLLASIKLHQAESSRGRKLMIAGFTLLTLIAISSAAQYFEILQTGYSPYMESDYYLNHGDPFEAWERWYYWGRQISRTAGWLLVAFGFIAEGRATFSKLRKEEQQSILSHE